MNKKDLKIEIRPIPNRGEIRAFSKTLEFFAQPHTIGAFVDPSTLRYATGLTEKDKEYLEEIKCPYNYKDTYIHNEPHEFWDSQLAKISLESTPQFLYPYRTALDFLKWKYLTVSAYIYNSEEEMLQGLKPQATHYIYNESEELELKASKLQRIEDLRNKVSKLSMARKRNVLAVLENENLSSKPDSYVTVKLSEIIDQEERMSELENLLNEDNSYISLLADIKMAIFKDVLTKKKEGIFFFESNLGYSEEDVAEFLGDKKNQELLLSIKSKLK